MTLPLWALIGAVLLPYIATGITAVHRKRQFGSVDNQYPRLQAAKLEGAGARAVGAQANAWEALTVFAPAAILAHIAGADARMAAIAAAIFLAARVLHLIVYLNDMANIRTLCFIVGAGSSLWLYWLAGSAMTLSAGATG
jgi:uncharacterized MAPEG superfamily protein